MAPTKLLCGLLFATAALAQFTPPPGGGGASTVTTALPITGTGAVATPVGCTVASSAAAGCLSAVDYAAFSLNSSGFIVVRTNPTTLSLGATCTTAAPCYFSFGTTQYSLTTATRTAVISSGSDTAYIYISSAGVLTVGTNTQTVTCTGCTAVTGVTSFPADSIALWTWTSTTGTWDTTGGTQTKPGQQKGADPLAFYLLSQSDTQLKNASVLHHQYGCSVGTVGGSALATTGAICYFAIDDACTISGYHILSDVAGTANIRFWKIATGTAVPTIANVINNADLVLNTGTALNSTTTSAFTSLAVAANDIGAMVVISSATAGYVYGSFVCH